MFYAKNVPVWERIVRVLAGVLLVAGGFWLLKGWMLYGLCATGVMIALTGFVGFCPMCALAGRKLDKRLKGSE